MTDEPTDPSDGSKIDLEAIVEKFSTLYLDALEQARTAGTTQAEHFDQMLTWAIGLMGAGVFYANTLLAPAPRGLRFVALAPWILGILASLTTRVMGPGLKQMAITWHMKEVLAFRGDLLVAKGPIEGLGVFVKSALRLWREMRTHLRSSLNLWSVRLWLAAHVFAGTGILTVVAAAFLAETPRAAFLAVGATYFLGALIFRAALSATMKTIDKTEKEGAASLETLRKSLEKKA